MSLLIKKYLYYKPYYGIQQQILLPCHKNRGTSCLGIAGMYSECSMKVLCLTVAQHRKTSS